MGNTLTAAVTKKVKVEILTSSRHISDLYMQEMELFADSRRIGIRFSNQVR